MNVGYGRESIVKAAAEQLAKLPYATGYFHFGSQPAIELAERLAALAPPSLNRVLHARRLGRSRFRDPLHHALFQRDRPPVESMIALERGYHGSSSIGAASRAAAFHRHFDLPRADQHHIPSPYPYRHPLGDDPQALIAASVAALEAKVAELGADNVAAFFCGRARLRRRDRAAGRLAEGDARRVPAPRHPVRR